MTDSERRFMAQGAEEVARMGGDRALKRLSLEWLRRSAPYRYSYHFTALGRPIIQYPQDIVAMQEIIWAVRPDLIIETGIAHGGSLIWSASMLALLDLCEAIETGSTLNPRQSRRQVLGIDREIRAHNRAAIEAHPLASRLRMIEGSSVDPAVIAKVWEVAASHERILVCLDADHTHDHVLAELEAYAPLVTSGSYCIVFDTIVDALPAEMFGDRAWGPGDNPRTAVREFLGRHPEFEADQTIADRLMITVAPDGYLRRRA